MFRFRLARRLFSYSQIFDEKFNKAEFDFQFSQQGKTNTAVQAYRFG
jgi:hypothetical protein